MFLDEAQFKKKAMKRKINFTNPILEKKNVNQIENQNKIYEEVI